MKRRLAQGAVALLVVAAALGWVLGTRAPPGPAAETRFLMDTLVTVTLWGEPDTAAEDALAGAFFVLEAVDEELARVPGTTLWQLNQAGSGALTPVAAAVLDASLSWARRSGGAFDPTVAPLLDLWNVPGGPHPPPPPDLLARAAGAAGWYRVRPLAGGGVDLGGTALDFGGIAKGWALDRAAEVLRAKGVENFLINAGGDLVVAGSKAGTPWRVGIQHPREPGVFLRVVSPIAGSLVTSGDYERGYEWEGERVHHLLDPRTGRPAQGCQSVTVWAPAAVDADALATAVFVLGPEEGLRLVAMEPGAEALVVDAEGRLHETPGFARVAPEVGPQ